LTAPTVSHKFLGELGPNVAIIPKSWRKEKQMKNHFLKATVLVLLLAGTGIAGTKESKTVAWISPKNQFASYLEAAVQKKGTPVVFTTIKKNADVLVNVEGRARKGSTWRAIFTANSGRASALSMSVVNAKTGVIVFSYTCHKGGHGMFRTGHTGFQSAAECLAKHWKDKLK
jgi:hypothetical protein